MSSQAREERIARLPQWAQKEIARLERDVDYLKGRLAGGPEQSNTFADPYGSAPRPLGMSPTIEFRFGDAWHRRFRVRLNGKELEVSGGTSIAVLPWASNYVKVRVER